MKTDEPGDRVPYVAYSTFKTFVMRLRANGQLPTQIDRSVLNTMPGGTQGVFLASLRALRLIDDAGVPSSSMEKLTVEDSYVSTLQRIIQSVYSKEALAELARGTPKTLAEAMPLKSKGTQNKAAGFLVKAALDLDLPVSPHLLDEKGKPKGLSLRSKNRSAKKSSTQPNGSVNSPAERPNAPAPAGISVQKIPLAPGREAQLYWPSDINAKEIARLFAALKVFKQFLLLLLPDGGIDEDSSEENEDSSEENEDDDA